MGHTMKTLCAVEDACLKILKVGNEKKQNAPILFRSIHVKKKRIVNHESSVDFSANLHSGHQNFTAPKRAA